MTAKETPKETPKSALVPVTEGDARRDALIRALGFDKLSEGQRELALAIAERYDLDPMLRHVVMVDGKPYITRDGLLHVAHRSGVFDGIEVDAPANDGKYWRTVARVYRKDFGRPFIYPGRYPVQGKNTAYAEEMAIKVAEVMCLRRAFDVSAPTVEEQWDTEADEAAAHSEPTSLAAKIAAKASAVAGSPEQPETGASAPVVSIVEPETSAPVAQPLPVSVPDVDEAEYREAVASLPEPEEPEDEPEPVVVSPLRQPESLEPDQAPTDDSDPLDHFKSWARGHDVALIRAVARELFPNATGFSQLNATELSVIQHAVTKAETAQREAAASERCAEPSPLTDNRCTLDPGHKGSHRHGTREAW